VQGVPTDEATLAEFRARYLYSGNASKTARELNLPERTGRELAEKLSEDPEFAEARRKLRAQALEEHVAMRKRVADVALERFEDANGGIDVRQFGGEDNPSVTITDKRHEYGKLVLDAEKNAHNLAKLETEQRPGGGQPVEVHVHLKGTDEQPTD